MFTFFCFPKGFGKSFGKLILRYPMINKELIAIAAKGAAQSFVLDFYMVAKSSSLTILRERSAIIICFSILTNTITILPLANLS